MEQHLELLGCKASDKVTGFRGVVTTLSFDLYGCIQVILTPHVDTDGKQRDGRWFDVTRLKIKNKKRVMNTPNYSEGYIAMGKKGAAEKPLP